MTPARRPPRRAAADVTRPGSSSFRDLTARRRVRPAGAGGSGGIALVGTYAGGVPVPSPTAETRWRCTLCGNLTRFDVQRVTRTREYVHVALSGQPAIEEREVL